MSKRMGDIIAELRREKGISQKEFSDDLTLLAQQEAQANGTEPLNASFSAVSMWEQNRREPRKEMRAMICDYFNVDMAYLCGQSVIRNAFQSRGSQIKIYEQADNNIDNDDYIVDTMILPEFLIEPDGKYFAMILDNDDLKDKGFCKGDIVVYRRTDCLLNNAIQCFKINGRYENRYVRVKGDQVELSGATTEVVNKRDLVVVAKYLVHINKA